MYKFTHDILHGDYVWDDGRRVGGIARIVEDAEQENHHDRTDAAKGDQSEAVAGAVPVTSRGGETDADCHDKWYRHRTGRHATGVERDRDEISGRDEREQKQQCIEDK